MGGAKGTRTPDPHTASVVRYQLRHSPKKLCPSKLHHSQDAFKVAAQAALPDDLIDHLTRSFLHLG
jgi:hypothetical protein